METNFALDSVRVDFESAKGVSIPIGVAARSLQPLPDGHFLRDKLPVYLVPSVFSFTEVLPLTPSGKIDRRRLVPVVLRPEAPGPLAEETWSVLQTQLRTIWQQMLHARGWAGINWPVEHGGTGWTPVQKYIFATECAFPHTPRIVPFGLAMVAPVIYTFGNEEQQIASTLSALDGSGS